MTDDRSPSALRVAFLIVDLGYGGAQRLLAWIAPRLQADVRVIVLKDEVRLDPGVPVRRLRMRGAWDARAIPRLVAELRDFRPHVLHTHLFHANVLGRLCGRLAGVPHIRSTLHTLEGAPWHRSLDRLTAPLGDSLEFVSDTVARHIGRPGEVVRYGVPTLVPVRPAESRLLVTASRLVRGKGIDDLIEILPPDARLRILGDGPDADRLKRLVHERGLRDRIDFKGWIDDVPAGLRGAAAAVFPSRLGEGSPVAVMESMMAGIPVIATDAGGTRELVEDGVTGWLVPPGRRDLLAAKIAWVLRHPAETREVAERAHGAARERFALDLTVARLERAYRSAAFPPCPAPRPG